MSFTKVGGTKLELKHWPKHICNLQSPKVWWELEDGNDEIGADTGDARGNSVSFDILIARGIVGCKRDHLEATTVPNTHSILHTPMAQSLQWLVETFSCQMICFKKLKSI